MQEVPSSNLGQDINFFFLKILFIPFIRDLQTYNFIIIIICLFASTQST
jgi:hypothetical protein